MYLCSFSLQTVLMSLQKFLKNSKPINDPNNLGYLSHNLRTLILNIIVFLWIPNWLTNLINFSFYLDFLKTLPWWYAILMIPFFFVLMIFSYFWITFVPSSGSCTPSVSLFNSSDSAVSFMMIDSNNCFFISSCDNRFVLLLSAAPFPTCKQKITTVLQI